MSKKSRKAAPRPAPTAAQRKRPPLSAKPSAEASGRDTAERIALALETIATHLSTPSLASTATGSLGEADAFIWHPDGRLTPVPRVSRVDIGLLRGIDRMRDIRLSEEHHGPPSDRHFEYEPTWVLRGLHQLHIEFTPAEAAQ